MASRFLCCRQLLTGTNPSTLLGGRASLSVSVSVSSSPRRPVSALYRTFGTVRKILGNEKTYPKIMCFDRKNWCTIMRPVSSTLYRTFGTDTDTDRPRRPRGSFGAGISFPLIYQFIAFDDKHWCTIMVPPPSDWSHDQIIDFYVKTLAKVVGSEEEARMKIFSVSTQHVFTFKAYISEEQAGKLFEMEGVVEDVLPDIFDDHQLMQPEPGCVLSADALQQSKPSKGYLSNSRVLDSIPYGIRVVIPKTVEERKRMRERARAQLKREGFDDGLIQYLINPKEDADWKEPPPKPKKPETALNSPVKGGV